MCNIMLIHALKHLLETRVHSIREEIMNSEEVYTFLKSTHCRAILESDFKEKLGRLTLLVSMQSDFMLMSIIMREYNFWPIQINKLQ